MQTNKRVYPNERKPSKWMSYLLLFLSAVIIVSGLFARGKDQPAIKPVTETTSAPDLERFDETRTTREITLPSQQWFALQLGAFEQETSAMEQAQLFRNRGAAGFVWNDSRYRVLAAVYPEKDDAQRVRQQLEENHAVDSFLFEISVPEIRLRLSGMKGQLDILEAAFIHADDTVSALQTLSVALDRQEVTTDEAIQMLQARKMQLDVLALRLNQRFTQPRNTAVVQLITFFEDYALFVEGLDPLPSIAALSTGVKYQTLRSLWLIHQLRDTL